MHGEIYNIAFYKVIYSEFLTYKKKLIILNKVIYMLLIILLILKLYVMS